MHSGSNSLQSAYQSIGLALLAYEAQSKNVTADINFAFNELREDLAFIQVEILEAYLEDLLNTKVDDQLLYLASGKVALKKMFFEFSVIILALTTGWLAIHFGFSKTLAFIATLSSVVPLALLYKLSPFMIQRRMYLARVLSREIARRRGRGDDEQGRGSIALRDFFIRTPSGGMQGAARIKLH